MGSWGFLTNHALVLVHVMEHPSSTLREIAAAVGITERATLSILRAMEEDEIVSRRKQGRNNRYRVDIPALLEYQAQHNYNVVEIALNLRAMEERLQQPSRAIPSVLRQPHPLNSAERKESAGSWGFLTNHALVLIHVVEFPSSTLREIADSAGITERATSTILRAMEKERIISRRRDGRRNKYRVDIPALLDYQAQHHYNVAEVAEYLMAMWKGLQQRPGDDPSAFPPT